MLCVVTNHVLWSVRDRCQCYLSPAVPYRSGGAGRGLASAPAPLSYGAPGRFPQTPAWPLCRYPPDGGAEDEAGSEGFISSSSLLLRGYEWVALKVNDADGGQEGLLCVIVLFLFILTHFLLEEAMLYEGSKENTICARYRFILTKAVKKTLVYSCVFRLCDICSDPAVGGDAGEDNQMKDSKMSLVVLP